MPEEAERKGLGTPATRAAILEKLVQRGFVQRKGKQLVPTNDGINLAVVLPELSLIHIEMCIRDSLCADLDFVRTP